MTFRALLFAYLAGGLTFIPLLITAIATAAWYLLPRQPDPGASAGRSADKEGETGDDEQKSWIWSGDAAADGTFAVLRRYDLQAAVAALDRKTGGTGTGGVTVSAGGEGAVGAEGLYPATGESVYQSMYRSVFVGSKNNSSTDSLLHAVEPEGSPVKKRPVPANVLYLVLRHAHLLLYDTPAQVEVKHVISLAHHTVSLQAGEDDDELAAEHNLTEAELFIKRTAIVLTPVHLPNGAMQTSNPSPGKPFYLFSANGIDKEDFYHALLANRSRPPIPRPLDANALIKLQSALHSSSLTTETRALSALVGRLFLALHNTDAMSNAVCAKIEKKLSRIPKPAFIPSLRVHSVSLGDAGPVISNLKLRDLNINGDMTLSADMKYTGGLSVTLLAMAKLDLGPRFKARTIDLMLKTSLQRINGTMLLRIKPPPSNRIWFCFESLPELDIRVEPVVSERKVTYGFVLRAIEERVRSAIAEGLVKPYWDDIPMPFTNTMGSHARGGLWSDDGEPELSVQPCPQQDQPLAGRNERTKSMPALSQDVDAAAVSTGISSASDIAIAKLRHSATLPVDAHCERTTRMRHPLRTLSASSTSVAVDGSNVESVRADDPSLKPSPSQTKKLWRPRTSAHAPTKDALGELRGVKDRAEQAITIPLGTAAHSGDEEEARRDSQTSASEAMAEVNDAESIHSSHRSNSSASTVPATRRTPSILSSESDDSTVATSMASTNGGQYQQKKANVLAATVAATTAARNWGWNAIQRNKAHLPHAATKGDHSEQHPMGRGQPLPPPGQPLPGPEKGIWGSVTSVRRKPVPFLHSRKSGHTGQDRAATELHKDNSGAMKHDAALHDEICAEVMGEVEEEFEPWQENSGSVPCELAMGPLIPDHVTTAQANGSDIHQTMRAEAESDLLDFAVTHATHDKRDKASDGVTGSLKKVPPPLPPRRLPRADGMVHPLASNDAGVKNAEVLKIQNAGSEEQLSDLPGLRVPEADAHAIAAENSTPELARGAGGDMTQMKGNEELEACLLGDATAEKQASLETAGAAPVDPADKHARTETGVTCGGPNDDGHLEHDYTSPNYNKVQSSEMTTNGDERHVKSGAPSAPHLSNSTTPSLNPANCEQARPSDSEHSVTNDDDEILSRVRARTPERTRADDK